MRILIVTTGYPQDISDFSGIFVKRLALSFLGHGHVVTVLAPGHTDSKRREFDSGLEIIRFDYLPKRFMQLAYGLGGIPENLKRYPWLALTVPFFCISMLAHVIFLSRSFDVVHANWFIAGLLSLPAKIVGRIPLVVTLRGSDFFQVESSSLSLFLRCFDAIVTVNEHWAAYLGDKHHLRTVVHIPNGVEALPADTEIRPGFGIGPNEIIVLFVGALSHRKGTDVIREAARLLFETERDIRFLLVGPGQKSQYRFNELPNVICTGTLPPEDTLRIYSGCDIFILPSRMEGRPNALLEAMACGLPVISTGLPGVSEVVTDECGIIIPAGVSRSLAEAIRMLARNPGKRALMGKNAKLRIEQLSLDWDSSASAYIGVFQEVCKCAE